MANHPRRSNGEFPTAPEAEVFRKACELAGIQPTKRQASKWRNHRGLARRFTRQAIRELAEQSHQEAVAEAAK